MRSIGTLSTLLKVADPVVIVLTALLSYWLRFDDLKLPSEYQAVLLAAFGLSVVVFAVTDVYRGRPDEGLRRNIIHLVGAWAAVVLAAVLLMYATQTGAYVSRQWLAVWGLLALVALMAMRLAVLAAIRIAQGRGLFARRIAIAGAGELGQQVARRLKQVRSAGLAVQAFYDDNDALLGRRVEDVPVRGGLGALKDDVKRLGIEQVWIALPLRAEPRVRELVQDLSPLNVEVCFVPDIFGFRLLNHSVAEIGGLPVIKITGDPLSGAKGVLKWVEDKVVAAAILIAISPLLLAIAIGVKLSSPGPIIFRQRRGGLDNREILVWKFRTMYVHDESKAQRLAVPGDPRITPFGSFLRRTSLDELPQFINVIKGDMSVVGPRPHPLWVHNFYAERIPKYLLRTWIKPGITGWAQICGWRGELSEEWKMEMRIQHDLYYLENWSLGFDLYIILMTPFRMRGERAY
jgi:putative colanic acid biosynthesis UDP-glucose lipid carrier transferase